MCASADPFYNVLILDEGNDPHFALAFEAYHRYVFGKAVYETANADLVITGLDGNTQHSYGEGIYFPKLDAGGNEI